MPEIFYTGYKNVRFEILKCSQRYINIVKLEEGEFADGIWKPCRVLNGDELMQTKLGDMAELRKFKVFLYKS